MRSNIFLNILNFTQKLIFKIWYQLYDLDNKHMNKDVREKVNNLQIPSNLTIRFVVKITWFQMVPPWPSDQQVQNAILCSKFSLLI